jgi:hypothetical protein
MDTFIGVILICLNSVTPEACTEETAVDVMSKDVDSELGCLSGWQEVIGRSPLREGVGTTSYVRTICRRLHSGAENGKPDAN